MALCALAAVVRARSLLGAPWYRLYFAFRGVAPGPGWRMYGRPTIHRCRGSRIEAGKHLEIRSWPRANPVGISHPCVITTLEPGSFIRIGDDVGISGGCLAAAAGITIGNRVLIGADVRIMDNDIHPLAAHGRRYAAEGVSSAPIHIGDDVFIAAAAIVLKGVTIGAGSIVGAGSVVTKMCPHIRSWPAIQPAPWARCHVDKRLLVFARNYLPEQTGIGPLSAELCTYLAGLDYQVRVVAAPPHYPEWRIHRGYRARRLPPDRSTA